MRKAAHELAEGMTANLQKFKLRVSEHWADGTKIGAGANGNFTFF